MTYWRSKSCGSYFSCIDSFNVLKSADLIANIIVGESIVGPNPNLSYIIKEFHFLLEPFLGTTVTVSKIVNFFHSDLLYEKIFADYKISDIFFLLQAIFGVPRTSNCGMSSPNPPSSSLAPNKRSSFWLKILFLYVYKVLSF